jgi:glycoside/pentoside/hexuronide:cation symporter, GPH family
MDTLSSEKLSAVEKIGYSVGDLAANLIFQSLLSFLAFFYVDVYGISATTAGVIIAAGGIVGAIAAPIMGLIADRTRTRWGQFRPWLLWTSVPFGVIALLAFSTPHFGAEGKVIYALATYVALLVIYAANNVPYSALSGVLTGSMADRNSLSSYRFVAVMFAQFVIQVLLLPLVLIFGKGNNVVGFHNIMILFSVVGVACFLATFLTTRERVKSVTKGSSIGQDVADLLRNRPWIVMLMVTLLVFITLALKGGMYIYYFKSYMREAALAGFLQDIGFNGCIAKLNSALTHLGLTEFTWPKDAATSAFSLFNAVSIVMMIIGIGFSKKLSDVFGKRRVFGGCLVLSTCFLLSFYFYTPDEVDLVFGAQMLHSVCYGVTIPLLWAMIADVADYSEWKNNRRATAIVFSATAVGLKAGLTIGSTLTAFILAHYGYDATLAVQSPRTVHGVQLAVSLFASIPFIGAAICVFFYGIDKKMELRLERDLISRRIAAFS